MNDQTLITLVDSVTNNRIKDIEAQHNDRRLSEDTKEAINELVTYIKLEY